MRASKIRSLGYWRSGERKTFHPSQLSPFLPQPNNGRDVPTNPHVLLFVLAFVFVCVQQRLFVCAGDHFSSVLCKHTSLHTFFFTQFRTFISCLSDTFDMRLFLGDNTSSEDAIFISTYFHEFNLKNGPPGNNTKLLLVVLLATD